MVPLPLGYAGINGVSVEASDYKVDSRPANREPTVSGGALPKTDPETILAGTTNGSGGLSPEAMARIEANKEAARKRKAARMLAIKKIVPTPTVATDPLAKGQAPPTASRAGGYPRDRQLTMQGN